MFAMVWTPGRVLVCDSGCLRSHSRKRIGIIDIDGTSCTTSFFSMDTLIAIIKLISNDNPSLTLWSVNIFCPNIGGPDHGQMLGMLLWLF